MFNYVELLNKDFGNVLLNNNYRLKSQLSQGSRGSTLLAVNTNHSPPTLCVIKQLENIAPSDIPGIIHTLQILGNHPQIPTLLDHFEQAGKFYVVQEFVNGSDCKSWLQLDGCFSASKVCQLLEDVLPILKFIHAHNVIHGDIKPSNLIERILNNSSGTEKQLVLVDGNYFSLINNHTYQSNFEYAAPEQIQGKAVFASDLYSLGLSCIQLLTDLHPFEVIAKDDISLTWHHYWLADDTTQYIKSQLIELLNQLVVPRLSQRLSSVDAVIHQMQLLGLSRQLQQRYDQSDISYSKQEQVAKTFPIQDWRCVATLTGHSGLFATVNAVAINFDGKLVASGSDDQTILIWDLVTKKQVACLRGHTGAIRTIAFSLTGKLLVSGSSDRTIKLWNLDNYQEIITLSGHQQAVNSVLFTPDGTQIISGSADKTIKLWDVNTTEVLATLKSHHLAVRDITYDATRNQLASASLDRTAKVWDLNNYQLTQTLTYHNWAVNAIAISPNGKILATGSDDNTIGIWDLDNQNLLRNISGHSWSVSSLVFKSNSELISGSWDKTVKIWQVNTGELQAVLTGHSDSVCAVTSSFDGKIIVSASKDKTLKVWQR